MRNDSWLEGIKAFEDNQPRDSNPYVKAATLDEIEKSKNWFNGYDLAQIVLQVDQEIQHGTGQ